ncbi:hypothetical protein F9762_08385 [Campylobacter jejuni]|nr:hypothetical protein [Campylobacter jejuni]
MPEDFKIHKSTLDEIERKAENNSYTSDIKKYLGIDKYYTNIDMAETIKQYYNQFNQIVNYAFNDTNKTSFTEADINSMPSGYGVSGTQWMDFNDPSNRMNITGLKDFSNSLISNVYKTPEQAKEMAKESFSTTSVDIGDIMTGKVDFASLFKYLASKNGKLEGQLYMYENNIPKESAMGNWALDAEIKQAIANGWKAKPSTINSYADSIMDRLNNLIGQTRV